MVQIKSVGVLQTAIILSVVYCLVSIPFAVFFALGALMSGHPGGSFMMLLMPLLNLVLGFISTALFCYIYNRVAERLGGIEIEWKEPEPGCILDVPSQ